MVSVFGDDKNIPGLDELDSVDNITIIYIVHNI